MSPRVQRWAPASVLLVGTLALLAGAGPPVQGRPLRAPLNEVVPDAIQGLAGRDYVLPEATQRAVGMSSYVMRSYAGPAGRSAFQLYVAYYDWQTGERRTHSPMACLPGSGWTPFSSREAVLSTPEGPVPVRYLVIQRESERAVVLYWYQGRGRVVANDHLQRWYILRDNLMDRRSEEALVRVIVPIRGSEAEAHRQAVELARTLLPTVDRALPT